jgi:hypothetical protein
VYRKHDLPMCRQRIDPAEWAEHGGTALGDVREWSDRACGMASLRMILIGYGLPVRTLTEMVVQGVASGAYATGRGWLHAGLADTATGLGLAAQAEAVDAPALPARLDDAPLIASVSHQFPDDGSRGGHLVVLHGYELGRHDPMILFRDPSRWGQDNHQVRLSRLACSFSGRCITFKPPETTIQLDS